MRSPAYRRRLEKSPIAVWEQQGSPCVALKTQRHKQASIRLQRSAKSQPRHHVTYFHTRLAQYFLLMLVRRWQRVCVLRGGLLWTVKDTTCLPVTSSIGHGLIISLEFTSLEHWFPNGGSGRDIFCGSFWILFQDIFKIHFPPKKLRFS